MRYFLDAEYNGFCGDLISVALVPEDEALTHFYAATECAVPTPWVAEHVLPVLGSERLPLAEVADRFAQYLIDDADPLLVADWPEDIAHAARLLVTGPGYMKPIRSLRFELVDPDIIGPMAPSEVPHHARHDAAALRVTMLAWEKRMSRL